MFTTKNANTDPLFLNESGSALNNANYLFHIKQILYLDLAESGLG